MPQLSKEFMDGGEFRPEIVAAFIEGYFDCFWLEASIIIAWEMYAEDLSIERVGIDWGERELL